jgi:hypothetical protein
MWNVKKALLIAYMFMMVVCSGTDGTHRRRTG